MGIRINDGWPESIALLDAPEGLDYEWASVVICRLSWIRIGQSKGKSRTHPGLRVGPNSATVEFHHFFASGKTDPGAMVFGFATETAVERKNFFFVLRVKSNPIVGQ